MNVVDIVAGEPAAISAVSAELSHAASQPPKHTHTDSDRQTDKDRDTSARCV